MGYRYAYGTDPASRNREPRNARLAGVNRNSLVLVPRRNSAFLRFLKCGSAMMYETLRHNFEDVTMVEKNDTLEYPEEITCLWRNPMDRTESMYKHCLAHPNLGAVKKRRVPDPAQMPWNQWVLRLLEDFDRNDDHARPQMELARNVEGYYLPTTEFFFDDIPALLAHYDVGMCDRGLQNRSIPLEGLVWSDYVRELHRDIYAEDWQKWESRELRK